MRADVELTIEGRSLAARASRGAQVLWTGTAAMGDSDTLSYDITQLLMQCPEIARAPVTVVLCSGYTRTAKLHGLQHIVRTDFVAEAARTNTDRFFIAFDGGTTVGGVHRTADGEWYGVAYPSALIASIGDACARAGAEFRCVASRSDALPMQLRNASESFTLASGAQVARVARIRSRVRIALCGLVALAAVGAATARTIAAERQRRSIAAVIAAERALAQPVAAALSRLSAMTGTLTEIERFHLSRTSMLSLLSSIARVLPDSTAIVSLRADSARATLILLTRSGPSVLERFSAANGLADAQVLGSFSREQLGTIELERVAIRARPARAGARSEGGLP